MPRRVVTVPPALGNGPAAERALPISGLNTRVEQFVPRHIFQNSCYWPCLDAPYLPRSAPAALVNWRSGSPLKQHQLSESPVEVHALVVSRQALSYLLQRFLSSEVRQRPYSCSLCIRLRE